MRWARITAENISATASGGGVTVLAAGDVILNKKPEVDQIPGPHGEVIPKATLTGFEKELTEGAANLKHDEDKNDYSKR